MTNARPTPSHRRRHVARKPLAAGLGAVGVLAGAWYATATPTPTTTAAAPQLAAVTNTTVNLTAKFPYLSAGYNNAREWTRTATAVAPNGTLRVAWQRRRHRERQRPHSALRQGPAPRLLGVPEERHVLGGHLHGHLHRHPPAPDRLERRPQDAGQGRPGAYLR
ncbi:hypothetical protein [Streptomyces mirabilis]|uniref:hypothetical protein n=1 Tax=Streptomyces mirabilis TaxID=68239 RepID=UPI0033B150C4